MQYSKNFNFNLPELTDNAIIEDINANFAVVDEKLGCVPVENGGTGAKTAEKARENLGITPENIGAQPKIAGAATTIAENNLTATRALVSDSGGKIAVSDITAAELKCLDGVTSNVQTQLNGKAASSHTHSTESITSGTLPMTRGGTGNTTGRAASATKLATSRTIQTNLESTDGAAFNGTADVSPGVTGILPVSHGGTGTASASEALANLGAVAKAGDTMAGDLVMAKADYPQIRMEASNHNNQGLIETTSDRVGMIIRNDRVEGYINSRLLELYSSDKHPDVQDALYFSGFDNGNYFMHKVLHTGWIPHPAQIATGSYKGTSSSSTVHALTFPFAPKLVMITHKFSDEDTTSLSGKCITLVNCPIYTSFLSTSSDEMTLTEAIDDYSGRKTVRLSSDGKSIYFGTPSIGGNQKLLNESGHTYYYVAFG